MSLVPSPRSRNFTPLPPPPMCILLIRLIFSLFGTRRRAQAQKAIEARAAAAEARIAAEKRTRAAVARSTKTEAGSSPLNKKLKVEAHAAQTLPSMESGPAPPKKRSPIEIDLLTDSEAESEVALSEDAADDVHFVGGGWETDEEDKPAVRLDDDEKRWLASDMRGWERTFADDGEDVDSVVIVDRTLESGPPQMSQGGASTAQGTRNGKARDEGPSRMRATPIASGSGETRKRPRAEVTPPAPQQPLQHQHQHPQHSAATAAAGPGIEVDDLTAEERAWLEADMAVHDEGVEDFGGVSGGKVAYMSMPAWMGGGHRDVNCGDSGGGRRYPPSKFREFLSSLSHAPVSVSGGGDRSL